MTPIESFYFSCGVVASIAFLIRLISEILAARKEKEAANKVWYEVTVDGKTDYYTGIYIPDLVELELKRLKNPDDKVSIIIEKV